MEQVDTQVLNKKLAEWAGFTIEDYPEPKLEPDEKAWFDPSGMFFSGLNNFVNFTNSLDACFEWLEPKLLGYSLFKQGDKHVGVAVPFEGDTGICDNAETPALALCLAIEKVIDETSS